VNGDAGLEGYYYEYDQPLAENERVRFARGERMPYVDATDLPRLDAASWPPERLHKTYRSYAMEYRATFMPVLAEQLGSMMAMAEIARTARLIGLHYFERRTRRSAPEASSTISRACSPRRARTSGSKPDGLQQRGWRLMEGVYLGTPPRGTRH
jgi:hypothetical protein